MNREKIEVLGATEPFFKYKIDGITYYEFDSSLCVPPEPMINAMAGLKLIDSMDKRVVMINMKKPMGLFPKIESDFEWTIEEIEDNKVKIVFRKKSDKPTSVDFDNSTCKG